MLVLVHVFGKDCEGRRAHAELLEAYLGLPPPDGIYSIDVPEI
jgi:hypothetical protein